MSAHSIDTRHIGRPARRATPRPQDVRKPADNCRPELARLRRCLPDMTSRRTLLSLAGASALAGCTARPDPAVPVPVPDTLLAEIDAGLATVSGGRYTVF